MSQTLLSLLLGQAMPFYCPSTLTLCAIHNLELGQEPFATMTSTILHSYSPFLGSLILVPCSWGNMIPTPHSWGARVLGLITSRIHAPHFWGSSPFLEVEYLLHIFWEAYFLGSIPGGRTFEAHSWRWNLCSLSLGDHTFWSPFLEVEHLLPIIGEAHFLGPIYKGRTSAPHS